MLEIVVCMAREKGVKEIFILVRGVLIVLHLVIYTAINGEV